MSSKEDTSACFFKCSNTSSKLITSGRTRIETIIRSSKRRYDGLHELLSDSQNIKCHKSCVSTYTSEHHIKRQEEIALKEAPPAKIIRRRSVTSEFILKKQCLFGGNDCEQIDVRHPNRWRKVVQCKTAERGKDRKSFKQSISIACDQRNDLETDAVRVRVQGAVSDLHAVDAQYHLDCYNSFMSPRIWTNTWASSSDIDQPFLEVVARMESDKDHLWNSVDLYEYYNSLGGVKLSRRYLVENVTKSRADMFIILKELWV